MKIHVLFRNMQIQFLIEIDRFLNLLLLANMKFMIKKTLQESDNHLFFFS